jgi:hypothetical protein
MLGSSSGITTAFGYYTRNTEGFSHDVYLKSEELRDVGLVMITARYIVVLTKEKSVVVVPSVDVVKIERKS